MEQLSFTSMQLVQGFVVTVLLVVAGIFLLRRFFSKKTNEKLIEKDQQVLKEGPISARNKYPEVDVFKLSNSIWNAGLALALVMTLLAFNWTTYEEEINMPPDPLGIEDDFIEEIPRTKEEPPPPPPPPPPPILEEVPDEEVLEEEPIFEDHSLEVEEETLPPPPPPKKEAPPPPPPPPPPPAIDVDEIFKIVEQMPTFPGCDQSIGKEALKKCSDKKLTQFLYKHLKYPAIARENGIEGNVYIQFVVEKDGSIKNARVVKDIGAQCGAEGLRVVNLMNTIGQKWVSGKQRGVPVRVQFTLPIKFRLN